MSASVGLDGPRSRLKLRIAVATVVAAGAVGFAAHRARAPRPDTFDASADPVGAAPEFVEIWRGEPVAWPPLVLPYVERRELTVIDPTLRRMRRLSLDGLELPSHRPAPELDHLLLYQWLPSLVRIMGPYLSPIATESAGRFVSFGFGDVVAVLDLADGSLNRAVPDTADVVATAPGKGHEGPPPARSRFTARDGTRVVVLDYGGPYRRSLAIHTGDDVPRGRRVRAHEDGASSPWIRRVHVEVVDAATGGVVVRSSGSSFAPLLARPSASAVDSASLSFGRLRGGVVNIAPLDGAGGESFKIGEGDVTTVAATSSGFVTGHKDGSLQRWKGRRSEIVAPARNGEVERLDVYEDRVVAKHARSDDAHAGDRVTVVVGDRIHDVDLYDDARPIARNGRWLCFTSARGCVAVGDRGLVEFDGVPNLVVGDWVVVRRDGRTTIVDLSGAKPRVLAEVPGVVSPPTVVRGAEGGFLLDGFCEPNVLRPAQGLSIEVSPDYKRWQAPTPSRVRPPARLPAGAAPSFAQAFEAGRLHECPRTGLLTRLDEPEGLDAWDPAAPPDKARRFRRWKGAVTDARLLVSPDGDRFVVPSWDIDALRFGDFARGLAADAEAPLVGPHRGDDFRKDKLHDGEVGGSPERGARFAFVANDVVAVCEPDAVRLRHVPTGRDLGRVADPAEAICISKDGATLLSVAGPLVTVLRRR